MKTLVARLFRPVYGEHFEVRPSRWWDPRSRRTARLAAEMADYLYPEIRVTSHEVIRDAVRYGTTYAAIKWMTEDEIRRKYEMP